MSITDDAIPDLDDFSDLDVDSAERSAGTVSSGVSSSRSGAPRRGRRPAAKKLESLQKRLSGEMFQAGAMIGFALPTTGYYIGQESNDFTTAIVQLASSRAEWLEALEHLANIQPGIVVGRTAIGIGAAVAVDRGRVEPDKKFLMALGVTAAYNAVHNPEMKMEPGNNYAPPPAKFSPVS
jgi:hypothetical protein